MADLFSEVETVERTPHGIVVKPAARARASDPSSSHAAAESHNRSGRTEAHALVVLFWVKLSPKSTYRELFARMAKTYHPDPPPFDSTEFMRRLDSLLKAGKVRKCGERDCVKGKRPMTTWEWTGA
jgi:hypothetical protein